MTIYRQFGLELETFHPTIGYRTSGTNIRDAIVDMGYRAVRTDRHFDADYTQWQIKPDASLSPAGYALEVVSPTLPGTEASITQVTKVANWLMNHSYDVNVSMGYHIHIDAADMTAYEAAAVALRYHHCQSEIDSILPPSRRGSRWAQPLSGAVLSKVTNTVVNATRLVRWDYAERYVAVNLQHIAKSRSERRIEFRQHSGTLNTGKIVGWYKFLCDFVAETLRIIRETEGSVTAAPSVTTAPIIRRQRTQRGTTRSVVTGTVAPSVPYIEPGTDYDLFLQRLADTGVVTQQDARTFGWPETRLRVTAHWLRRNGAELITTQRNGELAYVGRDGATSRADIFVNPAQVRQRVSTASPYSPAPAAAWTAPSASQPVATNRQELLAQLAAAPALSGASPETTAWFNTRRNALARI